MPSAILKLAILADAASASKALNGVAGDAESSGGRMSGAFKKIAGAMAAYFTVDKIVDFGKQAVDASMSLSKQLGATSNVFGDNASAVENWSKTSATALGLSQTNALEAANGFGTLGSAAGITGKDLSTFGTELTQRAVDIGAFYKKPPEDVIAALQSGLKGATKPLKQFGIMVDSNTLKQRAMKMGLIDTDKEALTPQQKTLAMHAEIMAQTADKQDAFAKSSNSLGKQQRILGAEYENFKAAIGNVLVPILTTLMTKFMGLVTWMNKNRDIIGIVVAAVGLMTVALTAQKIATTAVTVATQAWGIATRVVDAIMKTSTIGLVVTALVALAAAFIIAWKKSATFRNIVKAVFEAVKTAAQAVARFFTETIPKAFSAIWDGIKNVWDKVWNFLKTWGPVALAALVPFIGIPLLIWKNFSKIVGWLKGVWDKVKNGLTGIFERIKAPFVRAWQWMSSTITGWAGKVARWFANIVSKIVSALRTIWDKITGPFRRAWQWVSSTVSGWGGKVKTWLTKISQNAAVALAELWNKITSPFRKAWNWVSSTVSGWASKVHRWFVDISAKVSNALASVWEKIKAPFQRGWDAVKSGIETAKGFFTGIPGAIGRALAGVWDAITSPFKRAWDWIQSYVISPIKTAWNTVANAFNAVTDWSVSIPSWVPIIGGKSFSIPFPSLPTLQHGAFVTGPTYAMIGEAGAEWVLPDAKLRALLRQELSNLGPTIVVNGALDPDAVARQIERLLVARDRRVRGVRRAS